MALFSGFSFLFYFAPWLVAARTSHGTSHHKREWFKTGQALPFWLRCFMRDTLVFAARQLNSSSK